MKALHFTIPPLPPEPLWSVETERGPEKIRAPSASVAKQRIADWFGLSPTRATRIEEEDDANPTQ